MSRLSILLIFSFLVSCQSTYDKEHSKWKENRFKELKAPYGWPSVIGLFPIKVSYSFFGRSEGNEFLIENGASSFGHLEKTDTNIIMRVYKNIPVFIDSQKVTLAVMKTDADPEGPTIASYKSLQWHIIERESDIFLRVKDTLSPYRNALTEIPYFPDSDEYIVEGQTLDLPDQPKEISYTNILGQEITRKVAAYVGFEWKGQEHVLTAFEDTDETYFIMIKDKTSAITTYGGGRYLYPQKEDTLGKITLDFNKLVNPPCVFTPYATCPLPPKSNHLPFEVIAGEKDMHLY